jgi:hypothetical protein
VVGVGARSLTRALPDACNAAKRSGRRSGTQRKTREAPLTLDFAEICLRERWRAVNPSPGGRGAGVRGTGRGTEDAGRLGRQRA